MNKIQSESDNIKISNLIRLSRKKRNKCLKKTHKSFMWGGSSSKPKKSQRKKSDKKKSLEKNDLDENILEIECEVIMYGGIKYLVDKNDNVYSYPDHNEQYYLVGKKVIDYIKFNKDYQNMIESEQKKK